jgi:hypothetical protein
MPNWFTTLITLVLTALLLRLSGRTAILKDQLIPQLPAHQQTFSLARSQMAWWFLIILGCAVHIVAMRITAGADPGGLMENLITSQSLTLMGLAALTAAGGVTVDAVQYSKADQVNDALKQLKLTSYADVLALRQNIADWQGKTASAIALTPAEQKSIDAAHADQLAANPGWSQAASDAARADLTTVVQIRKKTDTITDLQRLSDEYERQVKPFRTHGWFHDMVTDIDGTALHRLQAVVWTVLIGAAFIYVALNVNAMPQLDPNLLGLMGISSAGYVGFKYNETQY